MIQFDSHDLKIFKNVLENQVIANEFVNNVDESIFINKNSSKFAECIIPYIKQYRVAPTPRIILDKVQGNEELHNSFKQLIFELNSIEPSPTEFKYDLDILKKKYIKHEAKEFKNYLNDTNFDSNEWFEKTKKIASKIDKIATPLRTVYNQVALKNYSKEFKRNYNDKNKNPNVKRGLQTGFKYFDYLTNGLDRSTLTIIGAETGGGKSIILNNMGVQMWMGNNKIDNDLVNFSPGLNVLYFSLEMPIELCVNRALAKMADVPFYGIRDASLSKGELKSLKKCWDFIEAYPNTFEVVDCPRGLSVDGIEERFKEACETYLPDVVIVDYLGLLEEPHFGGEDWLKLGYIAGKLHEFTRMYNVVCITAAQLNRPAKNANNELIGLHRFGRSSLMLHHASIGMMVESRPDEHTYGDMKLHIVKNRSGSLGSFELNKNLSHCKISDPDVVVLPDVMSKTYMPHEAADISALIDTFNWNDN